MSPLSTLKKGDLVWIHNRYNPGTLKYEPISPAKAIVAKVSSGYGEDKKLITQYLFIDQKGSIATFWDFEQFNVDFIQSTEFDFLGSSKELREAYSKGELNQYFE